MNPNPDVQEILKDWLKAHGFDGLVNDTGCGCVLDDLCPSHECLTRDCVAAYRYKCQPGYTQRCEFCATDPDEESFCMRLEKPEGEEA